MILLAGQRAYRPRSNGAASISDISTVPSAATARWSPERVWTAPHTWALCSGAVPGLAVEPASCLF
jgi:hypothetical protein